MFRSYTDARNQYGKLTQDTAAANLTLGDMLINEGTEDLLGDLDWWFLETSVTRTTVASQSNYKLAHDHDKILGLTVTVSSTVYTPDEVSSREEWDTLQLTTTTSDIPSKFFVFGDEVHIWPTPASSSNSVTIYYKKNVAELSQADYTTGTVTAIANGATTLTASGTTFIDAMIGRYIRIPPDDGDNEWYKIASITSTTVLELDVAYTGTTISGGTASYTIGEMSVLPQKYQLAPIRYAVREYWLLQDNPSRADRHDVYYEKKKTQMRRDQGNRSVHMGVVPVGLGMINPNLTVSSIG